MPRQLLSVLMPVYNAEVHLPQAIESILGQTFKDFEFIIINDGSHDNSLDIIKRYAKKDSRIKFVSRPNKGLVATLNEGLKLAQSEFIARMDADDISMPERFASQLEFLKANPDHVAIGSSFISTYEQGDGGIHHCFINDTTIRHALTIEGCIPHPSVIFNKQAVLSAGGYSDKYPQAEDYDLWRRLARQGKLTNLAEPLLKYRHSATSVSYAKSQIQAKSTHLIKQEVWQDKDLDKYKRIPIKSIKGLPGEYLPALKKLQRRLMYTAFRHRDFGLFMFLLFDVIKNWF